MQIRFFSPGNSPFLEALTTMIKPRTVRVSSLLHSLATQYLKNFRVGWKPREFIMGEISMKNVCKDLEVRVKLLCIVSCKI